MKLILESWRNYVAEEEIKEEDLGTGLDDAEAKAQQGKSDREYMEEVEETIEGKRPPGMGKRTMKDLDDEAKTRETNFLKKKKDEKKEKVKNPGKYMGGGRQKAGVDDDGDGVPNKADKSPKDGDIKEIDDPATYYAKKQKERIAAQRKLTAAKEKLKGMPDGDARLKQANLVQDLEKALDKAGYTGD